MRIRSAWRRVSSPSNPGFVVVLILCACTVVSFVLGFAFQPTATAPAVVPDSPTLNLTFPSGGPRDLSVYSFLEQAGSRRTELSLDATGDFAPRQPSTRWILGILGILGFTGDLCQPSASGPGLVPIRGFPGDYEISGTSSVPATPGQPFLVIGLCWDSGAPLITSGSYVSAALPSILAPGEKGTVTRSLVLTGTSLSSYSLAWGLALRRSARAAGSGPPPSTAASRARRDLRYRSSRPACPGYSATTATYSSPASSSGSRAARPCRSCLPGSTPPTAGRPGARTNPARRNTR